jgi:PAS domain S-box-containing protein
MNAQPSDPAGQIRSLQRCINDLVSLLALPAAWRGSERPQLVHGLLDALLRLLRLDLAYVRLRDSGGAAAVEVVRVAPTWEPTPEPQDIGEMLRQRLGDDPQTWPPVVRHAFRHRYISLVPLQLGLHAKIGIMVVGSQRDDFPQETEKLVLSVAANQGAIGLEEARLRSEQKSLANDLDERVARRTRELAEANEELRKEIAERKLVEQKLRHEETELRRSEVNKGAILDSALDGIIAIDHQGCITEFNRAAERTLGYRRNDVVGQTLADVIVPPSLRERHRAGFARYLATGESRVLGQRLEMTALCADGREIPVELAITRIPLDGPPSFTGYLRDITDRKRNEEALREAHMLLAGSEERWRSVFENSAVGVALADLNGRFIGTNPVFQKMLGYTAEELQNVSFLDITVEEYREPNRALLVELLEGARHQFQIEKQCRRKNGSLVWVRNNVSLVPGSERVPRFLMAIVEDISERKQAEDELRAAIDERTRLSAVRAEIGMALARRGSLREVLRACAEALVQHLDAAFARIWTLSNDGTELELQASAGMSTRLSGRYSRIPLGKFKIGQIAETRRAHLSNDLQNDPGIRDKDWARAEKLTSFVGYPLVVEGRTVGVMAMFSQEPIPGSTLETLSFLCHGIAQGIERKRAEEELRRSETFLAEGQRLSRVGSFSWRVATDKITWSEELYRIYELEQGVPITLELIRTRVHPEDLTLYEKMVEQARNGGNDFELQYRLLMSNHSIKYLHAVAHVTLDQDGQLEYIASIQDVTERRLSEEALDKARLELARVARVTSLGVLTASIAHEVNQPLSGIVTNASTCLRMLAADPPNVNGARETARRTIRDGNRASDVITRLRTLYSGKELSPEAMDLNEAAREVISLSLREFQRDRVILRPELADDLPTISGDRIQLQQVILNLVRNASDSMRTVDGRPRELLIKTERDDGDCVRLSVKDAGIGFEPQAADRLFEAFYTTKNDGMGIGLSISRSIIEAHQGRLWATANDGPGATFSFSIPCRADTKVQ